MTDTGQTEKVTYWSMSYRSAQKYVERGSFSTGMTYIAKMGCHEGNLDRHTDGHTHTEVHVKVVLKLTTYGQKNLSMHQF